MLRNKRVTRGRVVPFLLVGGIGYLIGAWQVTALRAPDLSAAASVALRFPQDLSEALPAATAFSVAVRAASTTDTASYMGAMQVALLNPEPMFPRPAIPQGTPPAPVQKAAWEGSRSSAKAVNEPPRPPVAATPPVSAAKAAAIAERHRANRPGYLLNDAQIASIKTRLNLTPDQEHMWPAVEAALRNIAYARGQDERRRGSEVQAAAIDPNSVEVQGLKSAATPLILSFNDEQKDEVRNIVHAMGLDQLAAQF